MQFRLHCPYPVEDEAPHISSFVTSPNDEHVRQWRVCDPVLGACVHNQEGSVRTKKPQVDELAGTTRRAPFRMKSPEASFLARVSMLCVHRCCYSLAVTPVLRHTTVSYLLGSEPWLGSVRPKQPTSSPVARRGKYCGQSQTRGTALLIRQVAGML